MRRDNGHASISEQASKGATYQTPGKPTRQAQELKRLCEERDRLARQIGHKDEVIAEITADYVRFKKNGGEALGAAG